MGQNIGINGNIPPLPQSAQNNVGESVKPKKFPMALVISASIAFVVLAVGFSLLFFTDIFENLFGQNNGAYVLGPRDSEPNLGGPPTGPPNGTPGTPGMPDTPGQTEPPTTETTPEIPMPPLHPFPGILEFGSENIVAVSVLQNALSYISEYFTNIRSTEMESGRFAAATVGAVADFQHRVGLAATGIVDADTWYSIMQTQARPPAIPDGPFAPPLSTWYITLSNLHLRAGPSTDSASLHIFDQGERIWVTGFIDEDAWFFASTPQGDGFMKAEFLILEELWNEIIWN
jgi:peptidoglycan hydrolase-like protein with peptidoglycan-binding domain